MLATWTSPPDAAMTNDCTSRATKPKTFENMPDEDG